MSYTWLKNNLIPALAWAIFHLALSSWQLNFFGLLIGTRALAVFVCLLNREEPKATGSRGQSILSWVSTLLPTLMIWQSAKTEFLLAGELVAIVGMVLFIWTCADLGKAFGVSPAVRTRADAGIYRFVKNPMYLSHVIVELGILIASPSSWNLVIAGTAWALYAIRSKWEHELWSSYCQRSEEVRLLNRNHVSIIAKI